MGSTDREAVKIYSTKSAKLRRHESHLSYGWDSSTAISELAMLSDLNVVQRSVESAGLSMTSPDFRRDRDSSSDISLVWSRSDRDPSRKFRIEISKHAANFREFNICLA